MHQQTGKRIFVYFLLLLTFTSINNINLSKIKFNKVKNINILGLNNLDSEIILNDLKNLNLENIFFINKNKITKIIDSNTLVEEFKVFKKYPSTLNIEIQKTIFLAKINKDDKIFIIGSNGKLSKNDSTKNFPYIFGNPEISEFIKIKKMIEESKISYDSIKNLYFFKSKRWDIELKNNILIKLPKNNVKETLNDAFNFMEDIKIGNIKIIDARIKNQIIING